MVDERTPGFPEPFIDHDGAENGTTNTKIFNRCIAHAIIALVDNDRFTSLCTLDIHPEKKYSKIQPATVHQRIFDTIKTIDHTAIIITSDNIRTTHSKDIPSGKAYEQMILDIRTDAVTKRIYLSIIQLKSTHSLSKVKFGSKHDDTTGIFDTLRDNLEFINLKSFNHKLVEASTFSSELIPI